MSTWIYCPRSGHREFIVRPSPAITVTTWPNGSREVDGSYIHLSWDTAEPRRWWRSAALMTLEQLIGECCSGIAWDVNGTVHACVAPEDAQYIRAKMREACPHSYDDRANAAIVALGPHRSYPALIETREVSHPKLGTGRVEGGVEGLTSLVAHVRHNPPTTITHEPVSLFAERLTAALEAA